MAVYQAIRKLLDFDTPATISGLIQAEASAINAIESLRREGDSDGLKYLKAIFNTHLALLNRNRQLDVGEETMRIKKVVMNLLEGRSSLGAAVLEIMEERRNLPSTAAPSLRRLDGSREAARMESLDEEW